MFNTKQSAIHPYATRADFCRIFESDMNRLYLLCYLLTADHGMAEECFVRGLEDTTGGNRVFRDWVESWARRTIIHNAIQLVRPRPSDTNVSNSRVQPDAKDPAPISAVVELPAFERFVFVMSVLERQSVRECSLLLGCGREDVAAARIRTLQKIGAIAQRFKESENIGSSESACRTRGGSSRRTGVEARLVASA
jgi:DNA-directed RNA polymerase specialized sigma24 family protein